MRKLPAFLGVVLLIGSLAAAHQDHRPYGGDDKQHYDRPNGSSQTQPYGNGNNHPYDGSEKHKDSHEYHPE